MAIRQPSMFQKIMDWAGNRVALMIWAGRMRNIPQRMSMAYAKLANLGNNRISKDRPLPKPTPTNLRRFGRTVYARRAINRVKGAVASLKWEVRPKKDVTLSSEIKRQTEIVKMCFSKPNQDDSFRSLIEQVGEDILTCGAGAIEQELGAMGVRPLWMWPVDALSIEIYAGWSGDRTEARYSQAIGYGGNVGGVMGIPLLNDQLIYIRKDPSTDNPFGVGCLEVAFNSINRLLSTAEFAGNVAGNSQPANMIQFKGMDKVTLETFRRWWRNDIEGEGQTPLIGGDEVTVHPLRGTTDDALYLKYQEFLIREIATAFEISPHNLGIEHDVNRANAEVSEDRDWQSAIIPLATNIESYLNREAIEGKLGFSQIEFAWIGIDRDDEEMLANIHSTYYKTNALTPNEIREKLGRPPLKSKWGDMLFIDTEIAKTAAKGVAEDLDPDLQDGKNKGQNPDSQDDNEAQDKPGKRSRKTKYSAAI